MLKSTHHPSKKLGIYLFNQNRRPKNGYILFAVLLLMQLLAALALIELTQTTLTLNQSQQTKTYQLTRQEAILLLTHLSQHLTSCHIPLTSPITLKQASLSWWRLQACTGDWQGIAYFYAIEFLENDACTQMAYYRLSLKIQQWLFQSTIAVPNQDLTPCQSLPRKVIPGIQMSREIS